MTTLVLPYRDDEYGVPVLQFSESDSDSDSETTVSKPKTNKTLPSIGPPQILQVGTMIVCELSNQLFFTTKNDLLFYDQFDQQLDL